MDIKKINLIIFMFLITVTIFSKDKTMQLSEVKKGMTGIGYTVVQGEKIEKFKFEILNLIPGENSINKMILARFYDGAIKSSGGISEGMSGSPLYINNKLIGALSYILEGEDKNIGLVTPIGEMLKLGKNYDKIENKKNKFNLIPGTAVAISPVRGDVNLDSIGTLTCVKDNLFYALGHPIDRIGKTKLFIKKANIFYSVASLENSFKLGKGNETFGIVLEDRDSGILGIISDEIETYKFNLEILIDGKIKKIFFEMPKDTKILKRYLGKAIEIGLNSIIDSNEFYTLSYDYTLYDIESNKLYSNSNLLYFENDLIENTSLIIEDEIITILNNPFKQIDFNDLSLFLTLYKKKKIAYLNNINIPNRIIRLGEKINLKLDYFLYQGVKKVKEFKIEIPENFSIGNAEVIVKNNKENNIRKSSFQNLKEYLDYYKNMYKNNEIVIEIIGSDKRKIIKKVYFESYLQGEKELKKNIIIDTFEANDKEKVDDYKIR